MRKKTRAMHVDDHCLNFGGSLHGRVRLFIFFLVLLNVKRKKDGVADVGFWYPIPNGL